MTSKPKPHRRHPPRRASIGLDSPKPTVSAPRWTVAILLVGVVVCLALVVWRRGLLSPENRRPLTPIQPPAHDAARTVKSPDEERSATCVAQANQLLKQGKVAEALALYREAEQLTPGDEDVHYNLGIALARLGQTNEAVAAYQTALRLFPEYAEAHNNLGNLLVRCGRVDEGLGHFRAALRALPDDASAHSLGVAATGSGPFAAAASEATAALGLDEQSRRFFTNDAAPQGAVRPGSVQAYPRAVTTIRRDRGGRGSRVHFPPQPGDA